MKKEFDMEGSKVPTLSKAYLAKDGLYYNGYCGSPDFGSGMVKKIKEAIDRAILKTIADLDDEHLKEAFMQAYSEVLRNSEKEPL